MPKLRPKKKPVAKKSKSGAKKKAAKKPHPKRHYRRAVDMVGPAPSPPAHIERLNGDKLPPGD